jgi:glycine hydroxymethyltransferase
VVDFLFRGNLSQIDPDVAALIDLEAVRQARKLILIPSESTVPFAVREALSSPFHNIYAEGYPPSHWRKMVEDDILDVDARLAELRRNSGKRYYQGAEIADLVESLARRRTAERFANERVKANDLFVNVQPLSGAPANSAVYTALIQPGDTIMGMNLLHGGHLTHGSPVARSGLQYKVVSYGVRPDTERLDYDEIRALAVENKPKIIVAGFTSYPWMPDWAQFRSIADEVGAILLADMSHVAGLIIAGVVPSPVGIVDITMMTTHKTLGGPRGAVLITHKSSLASKIDRGVFPGEQGGPHVNSITALAVAMKLAGTVQFKSLQQQTAYNAKRMAERLSNNGLRIIYGGTDTHMLVAEVGKIKGHDGTPLSGDMAARILDIAGIVCNRNTIPSDVSPFRATGVRFGTPWITQRGFREQEIDTLSDAISELLLSAKPFSYAGGFDRKDWRSKVDFETLVRVKGIVNHLATEAGIDYALPDLAQYYEEADAAAEHFRVLPDDEPAENWQSLEINGSKAARFLDATVTSDVYALKYGDMQPSWVLDGDGRVLARAVVERLTEDVYLLHVERNIDVVAQWLIALSDGYTQFDPADLYAKVPGAVSVSVLPNAIPPQKFGDLKFADNLVPGAGYDPEKAYFVGVHGDQLDVPQGDPLPVFAWQEPEPNGLLTTTIHDLHVKLGAKMVPFAGYDMPVWYKSVSEEHLATRQAAGLFDVTHMGVFEFTGAGAEAFLNAVSTNDVSNLKVGKAHYSYLLGVDGLPLDDIFIYRLDTEEFMVVVNASNNDKLWVWLNAVKDGAVAIDAGRAWAKAPGRNNLYFRDLRAKTSGMDQRVDVALQGPKSRDVLLKLQGSDADKAKVKGLAWASVTRVNLGGHDLIVSRTGYTGERMAFEIFVHPEEAPALFEKLIEAGATPCGLAARDSLRTEAGLPLYGHELAGDYDMNPADAGFASYVKLWKPFFIGKQAYLDYETKRDRITTRFRLDSKGVRPPQPGDPVLDKRGRVVGVVTSCSIDSEGYQLGQALLKTTHVADGTPILIYSNAANTRDGKSPAELKPGDRTAVPESATVISRFPKRGK